MTELEALQARVVVLESDRKARGWLTLLTAVGVVLALVLAGSWVQTQNNKSIEREREARLASEQAFCGIIILLDDAWNASPPPSSSGKSLAAAVAHARVVNHCSPRPKE
jgi:Tfp pilus assembly protein PilN